MLAREESSRLSTNYHDLMSVEGCKVECGIDMVVKINGVERAGRSAKAI